jgi:hypothetical protein
LEVIFGRGEVDSCWKRVIRALGRCRPTDVEDNCSTTAVVAIGLTSFMPSSGLELRRCPVEVLAWRWDFDDQWLIAQPSRSLDGVVGPFGGLYAAGLGLHLHRAQVFDELFI